MTKQFIPPNHRQVCNYSHPRLVYTHQRSAEFRLIWTSKASPPSPISWLILSKPRFIAGKPADGSSIARQTANQINKPDQPLAAYRRRLSLKRSLALDQPPTPLAYPSRSPFPPLPQWQTHSKSDYGSRTSSRTCPPRAARRSAAPNMRLSTGTWTRTCTRASSSSWNGTT